jgi:hypothetical protein
MIENNLSPYTSTQMKKVFILFLLPFLNFAQSTTITAGTTANVNFPKLTYSQIIAIPSPQEGMQAFDTDYGCIRVFNKNQWRCHDTPESEPIVLTTAIKSDAALSNNIFATYNDIFFNNSTIVAGVFMGSVTFGTTTLTSAGDQDIFLVKYDNTGAITWAKRMGGAGNGTTLFGGELVTDVITELGTQNFYLIGAVASSTVTGITALSGANIPTAASGSDGFIAKFDAAGDLIWANTFNGTGTLTFDGFNAMSLLGNDIYVAGYQSGGTTVGGFGITAPKFVVKYNNSGVAQWVYETSGTINDITCNSNKLLITGNFNSSITFGSITYTSFGAADAYIACLNNLGALQWSDAFGSISGDAGRSVIINNGKVVMGGNFNSVINWGSSMISSMGSQDIFLAQYDLLGNKEWIKAYKGSGVTDNIMGMKTDILGNIYLMGPFNGRLWFEQKWTFPSNTFPTSTWYVAKITPNGACQWIKTLASNNLNISGFANGNIILSGGPKINISGYFSGTNIKFGHSTLTSNGSNMFVATIIEN